LYTILRIIAFRARRVKEVVAPNYVQRSNRRIVDVCGAMS